MDSNISLRQAIEFDIWHLQYIKCDLHLWSERIDNLQVKDRCLVSSVGRAPVCCAGGRGFEPQTGPTLRVLK